MAYTLIVLEGSVGGGESTGLGFRRTKAHPQFANGLLCDLEQSAKPLGLRSLHWGDLKGLPSFLPLWEFQGWKAKLGHRHRGDLQAAVFFLCLAYFLC